MATLPYKTPAYAWRFILILHRLGSLDVPLRVTAAENSSINTARAKIFQGRQCILESHDPSLARYTKLAQRCVIHTAKNILTVEKSEEFDATYSDLQADSFTIVYRSILPQLLSNTKSFALSFSPHTLSSPQIRALREFILNYPGVKFAQILATSATIAR